MVSNFGGSLLERASDAGVRSASGVYSKDGASRNRPSLSCLFPDLIFAHRALCAAAIRLRPAADNLRLPPVPSQPSPYGFPLKLSQYPFSHGLPRLDVQRPRAHLPQPLPQLPGNELRPIVRTNVLRYPAHHHHIRQRFDHLQTSQAPRHPQRQALPRVLVYHHQDAQRPSIVRHRLHKIVAPHMIRPLRPQPDTRTISEPQPPSWPLFLRYLQPFASPDPLHSILPHRPPRIPQQHRNASVAVSPILSRQGQDRLRQLIFVRAPQRQIALCSSPLPYYSARPPLTHFVLLAGMLYGPPTSLRA